MKQLPRYLIARNKITRLVDVIDTETMKPVSSHRNHDKAEAEASRLLRAPALSSNERGSAQSTTVSGALDGSAPAPRLPE